MSPSSQHPGRATMYGAIAAGSIGCPESLARHGETLASTIATVGRGDNYESYIEDVSHQERSHDTESPPACAPEINLHRTHGRLRGHPGGTDGGTGIGVRAGDHLHPQRRGV